jgi:hypothetical protein
LTLTTVEQAAHGVPQLQVAVEGCWERAVTIRLPAPASEVDRLLAGLSGADVAVELVWGPPIVFVGARLESVARPVLCELAARRDWTASGALAVLASGPPGPPVRAELGAVNAWRSVGPLPIAIDADTQAIARALAGRPDLMRCRRPVALEVVHQNAREIWSAIQVSTQHDDIHRTSAARVAALLSSLR